MSVNMATWELKERFEKTRVPSCLFSRPRLFRELQLSTGEGCPKSKPDSFFQFPGAFTAKATWIYYISSFRGQDVVLRILNT